MGNTFSQHYTFYIMEQTNTEAGKNSVKTETLPQPATGYQQHNVVDYMLLIPYRHFISQSVCCTHTHFIPSASFSQGAQEITPMSYLNHVPPLQQPQQVLLIRWMPGGQKPTGRKTRQSICSAAF